jgi:hypothetical protein
VTGFRERTLTWSYGGGTQSIAILLLIEQGKLPKPATVVMADTGREGSQTWEYHYRYVEPIMDSLDIKLEIAGHELAGHDLYNGNRILLPAFTEKGKGMTFCSSEWKAKVIRSYFRSIGYGTRKPVITWIGISVDEMGRMKPSGKKWQELYWTLVLDVGITREECRKLILDYGLPEPPKSSCWMCPYRSDSQWLNLKQSYPDDWASAVNLDAKIRKDSYGSLFLHESRVPLGEVVFGDDTPDHPLFGSIDGCDSGYCNV